MLKEVTRLQNYCVLWKNKKWRPLCRLKLLFGNAAPRHEANFHTHLYFAIIQQR